MESPALKKLKDITGIVLLFLSLILALSLFTYSPFDVAINVSSSQQQYSNFIGRVGALCADGLFYMLGTSAFLLIVPIVLLSVKLLIKKPMLRIFSQFWGFLLVILSFSGLFEMLDFTPFHTANFNSGGVIGASIIHILTFYINKGGAVILVLGGIIVGILMITSRTIDELAELAKMKITSFKRTSPKTISSTDKMESESFTSTQSIKSKPEIANIDIQAEEEENPLSTIPTSKLTFEDEPNLTEPSGVVVSNNKTLYRLPPLSLLKDPLEEVKVSRNELQTKGQQIIQKYAEFGIKGSITNFHPGPVVTLFEFKPAPGVKYSRITSLVDDLCLGLQAISIRVDRIPGKATIGIEVPNKKRQIIYIKELLSSTQFKKSRSPLTLAFGKRINGDVYVTDLIKMPHLLIAGATGSGKSVGINTMITSILYKSTPESVKFILIDPKRLELGVYKDIPHLLAPIVTDAKEAANTLLWAVHEMEGRYKLLAKKGVRDIIHFNRICMNEGEKTIPYIVIVIDELAELLSVASKEVELCLQRLAQMARAVGMHLIIATQRPSVEVITGVIKANFPSRISFSLLSKHDSKTILDTVGAEKLLGKGDMLFLPPSTSKAIRIHGGFISEEETKKIVDFLLSQGKPDYIDVTKFIPSDENQLAEETTSNEDPIYDEVARFVVKHRKASTSLLQRRFRIGYGRAARLIDTLEEDGIIGPSSGSRPREVIVPPDFYDQVDSTKE